MLENIFNEIKIPEKNPLRVLEIGTGDGKGTTLYVKNILDNMKLNYKIDSYEGVKSCYDSAKNYWDHTEKVNIVNKFFCNKEDISKMVIPNIISEGVLDLNHYKGEYLGIAAAQGNFENTIDYVPDIVLIDSWRFCHVAIVNKCKEFCGENTIFIMEDDFDNYGETKILKKYFDIKNLKNYDGDLSQGVWNFVTFTL